MNRRGFFGAVAAASQIAIPLPAVAANPEPIKIGQSGILSGSIGAQLLAYNKGAQLVFDRVNRSGGIDGRPIELISLDDGFVPDQTAKNTVRLLNEYKVSALFGYIGGVNLAAALALRQKRRRSPRALYAWASSRGTGCLAVAARGGDVESVRNGVYWGDVDGRASAELWAGFAGGPHESLQDEARALASKIAANPGGVLRMT